MYRLLKCRLLLLLLAVVLLVLAVVAELMGVGRANPNGRYTEAEGRSFMERANRESANWTSLMTNAKWDYESNLTDSNLQNKLKLSSEIAVLIKQQWEEVMKYPWNTFEDPSLTRQFKMKSVLGTFAMPEDNRSRLEEVIANMKDVYSTTKLLEWRDPGSDAIYSPMEPTIQAETGMADFFTTYTNDTCKLQYYWEGWHGSVGRKEKPLFEEYVKLTDEKAKVNNFTDNAAYWNQDFEMDDFDDAVHKLYLQILPFYQQLHAYVRRRLAEHHNTEQHKLIENNGCLPAHILGSSSAQKWSNVYNVTVPYSGKASVDVSPTMRAQNFTTLKMFKMAEEFYTSLNLSAMTETFWKKSIMEKPKDRDLICHPSSWNFYTGEDYRIKMCAKVKIDFFKIIHHEMGHIQYFMQYNNQPTVFRQGANSGFHEAVGDTIALSVSTAEHLIKVGLLDPKTYLEDEETEINSLYLMALDKVTSLPYAYGLDLWRWEIFRGNISSSEYNCRFWQIRQELQGIVPPVDRSAEDFDGGAKYHVIADVPYVRYFVSYILQFQFHKALCIKAGQYDPNNPASKPLHQCDIYQSKEAGNLFGKVLQMGSSKPPQEAMEVITGQRDMDAGALLEYFKPLHDWLVRENRRTGETIGWPAGPKIGCSHNGEVKLKPEGKSEDQKCRYVFPEGKFQK